MGRSLTILMAILYILTIDWLARLIQRPLPYQAAFKSPGLIAQGILALVKRPSLLKNQSTSFKRYFLSLAVTVTLFFALSHLFELNPAALPASSRFLALVPVFAWPFYHFVYSSQTLNFVAMQACLNAFRLRGVLSILFASNIIFLQVESSLSMPGLIAHATCAFLSLVCSFYLFSQKRQKPSAQTFCQLEEMDCGQPAFLHYFVSTAEIFYYILLFHLVFIQPHIALLSDTPGWFLDDKILIFSLIFITAFGAKFFFHHKTPFTVAFFEEILLPLSFLIFISITLLQIDF